MLANYPAKGAKRTKIKFGNILSKQYTYILIKCAKISSYKFSLSWSCLYAPESS